MTTVLETAKQYIASGFSVLPIAANGTKAPVGWLLPRDGNDRASWIPLQQHIASESEVDRMFRREDVGIGVIAGRVSGNLEVLDFDKVGLFEEFAKEVTRILPDLVERLPQVKTPRGGFHVYYRSDNIEGNQKLAEEPEWDDQHNPWRPKTLIETRGEGGYVVSVGSPAKCHESGRTYEHIGGPALTAPPRLTATERMILLTVARSFNLWVDDEPPIPEASSRGDLSPGDDFSATVTWDELLVPEGWTKLHSRGEVTCWRRPGKDNGWSATTGIKSQRGNILLYVFSTNAYPFEGAQGSPRRRNHQGTSTSAQNAMTGRRRQSYSKSWTPSSTLQLTSAQHPPTPSALGTTLPRTTGLRRPGAASVG